MEVTYWFDKVNEVSGAQAEVLSVLSSAEDFGIDMAAKRKASPDNSFRFIVIEWLAMLIYEKSQN